MSSKCSQIAELEKQFADWSVEMEKKNEALRKLSMEYDMLLALKVNAEEVIQKQACALNRLKSSDDCVVPVVVHDQSLLEQLRDKEKQLEVAQLQLAQAREDAERAHLNAANLQAVAKVLESDLNSSMSESDDRIRQLQMQIESLIDRGEVNNV
ncbi:hypothetical protein AB6A40_009896 [Gnathostoma spinigerum]|uniref:Uncharacterized protein n=1 Tax=Gnathostoma spinigerum TaxID=75299 RepID=A0ABD6EVQ4_9BILA